MTDMVLMTDVFVSLQDHSFCYILQPSACSSNMSFSSAAVGSTLPVFERGSGTCLGVVEIVTTTQKMNYRPEVENICKALEAVNLRISTNLKSPSREFLQVYNHFYHAALPEVSDFLTSVGLGVDIIGSG
ncbi:protein NLP2 isoform X1 [Eutrema salsugineum]|uniref:protein NLP2 isoform X1 n=2 Tax=Eutrema salsugineum TaxID=72664 RepID=UPI000CED489F|nr:protein NLP2 isoform X1 [Eutrema salsugineum]